MIKKRLLWINFATFLAVILLCIGMVGHLALEALEDFHERAQTEALFEMSQLIRERIDATIFQPQGAGRAMEIARESGRDAGLRITIIEPGGRVIADNQEDPARLDNHARRPEVAAVLAGESFKADTRFSNTLKAEMLYVAIPFLHEGRITGVLRVSRPKEHIQSEVAMLRWELVRSGLVAALLAGVLSLFLSRRMSRPIEIMREAAERYGQGDYSRRLFINGPAEFIDLAKSMNRMAREINRRVRQITRERNEREAILASMREGVLALDLEERILTINPSAEALLGVHAADSVGRLVQEALRHAELQRLLGKALAGEAPAPEECLIRWPGGRLLQLETAPLRDEEGAGCGLLVVINDVTRLHQLENVRREFVANVSHELRTPITSIKGFIETLRDGAMDDPDHAERFLEIIARQADRLNAIIEDLLTLSRIEREDEGEGIETGPCRLAEVIKSVALHFGPQSADKRIAIALECPDDLEAPANEPLLEQALGNLVDNAIKYSPEGRTVRLEAAREEGGGVRLSVTDEGCGIAPQHQARIFERFYRVDPARSREAGGTGLGLAIVKHIVQAHGGRVAVESQPGQGSRFSIYLPG